MDDSKDQEWFEPGFGKAGDYPVKREYRRIIFRKIMGVYTCIEGGKIREVEVINITPKGCAFRAPSDYPLLAEGDEVVLRFYFTLDTYLSARLEIRNRRSGTGEKGEGMVYGAAFDQGLASFRCLRNFIENIYLYAEHCVHDNRGGVFGG